MSDAPFVLADIASESEDEIFNELYQAILATLSTGNELEDLPSETKTFFLAAHVVGVSTGGGLDGLFCTPEFMNQQGEFNEAHLAETLKAIDTIGASEAGKVLRSASDIWIEAMASASPTNYGPLDQARTKIFQLEQTTDIESDILPKAVQYALDHCDQIDSSGLNRGNHF